jgi:hypothetical protein
MLGVRCSGSRPTSASLCDGIEGGELQAPIGMHNMDTAVINGRIRDVQLYELAQSRVKMSALNICACAHQMTPRFDTFSLFDSQHIQLY